MPVSSSRVSVAATATKISEGYSNCTALVVKNVGAVDIDLGGSAVTTGAGFPLAAGASFTLAHPETGVALYGITASGTCSVAVLGVYR